MPQSHHSACTPPTLSELCRYFSLIFDTARLSSTALFASWLTAQHRRFALCAECCSSSDACLPLEKRSTHLIHLPTHLFFLQISLHLTFSYYSQRATPGGLLITEANCISPEGVGYVSTPGNVPCFVCLRFRFPFPFLFTLTAPFTIEAVLCRLCSPLWLRR